MKGIIALDIDGTITKSSHDLHPDVAAYFNRLIEKGYHLMFITGRTFAFAAPTFTALRGTFYLGVQNGAALYEMPSEKQLSQHYIDGALISPLASYFNELGHPLMIESGKEGGDACYYCRDDFSSEELRYIDYRIEISRAPWVAVESFEEISLKRFPAGKFFTEREGAHAIAQGLRDAFDLNAVVIKDAFKPGTFLAHINRGDASKGKALAEFHARLGERLPVIAAGDDYNDLAMLMESDVKIVMEDAPDELKQIADVIAKPADELGIIEALDGRID